VGWASLEGECMGWVAVVCSVVWDGFVDGCGVLEW
jgi:hypothetical protein